MIPTRILHQYNANSFEHFLQNANAKNHYKL